jgi:hypothetical protein
LIFGSFYQEKEHKKQPIQRPPKTGLISFRKFLWGETALIFGSFYQEKEHKNNLSKGPPKPPYIV